MIKKIPLNDLKPGMFVSAFDLSWFKHPYVSTRLGLVRDQNLIEELRRLGVGQVEIDTSRSALAPPAPPAALEAESLKKPRLAPCPPISDPDRTARFAKKLFDHAMLATKALMEGVTKGKAVDIEGLQPLIARLIDSVNQNENVLHVLLSLKAYDSYTYTHSLNLAGLGVLLGKSMGLETADLETLGMAGILHDVGKCLVPKEIIAKPGSLTPVEFEVVKLHPSLGYEHLRKQGNIPEIVLRSVLEHHERIDGTGYPAGLTKQAIHPFSSIISVVDVYDALTSYRAYRSPVSPYLALRTLFSLRGQAFPEDMVDRFIKHLGVYPSYSVVQLRNGCYALVIKQTPGKPLFPEVMVFCDSNRRPVVKRKVDTWRLCGEMARKEFEIERPVEPDELSAPTAAGIA